MKRIAYILLLAISPAVAQAQFGGVLNKIKSKTKNRVDSKIDNAIENSLDKLEGKTKAPTGNETPKTPAPEPISTGTALYSKYDFVAGEQVIYSNDFATDNAGEMPTGWNSNGTAAVVQLEGHPGKWVQLFQNASYLTDNTASFSDDFTVEFDLVLRRAKPSDPFPGFTWGVLSSGSQPTNHSDLLKGYATHFATEMNIQPGDPLHASMQLQTYTGNKIYLKTDTKTGGNSMQRYNTVVHIAMQVQQERLRIWWDEEKIYDLPKAIVKGAAINQLYFIVKRYGGPDQEVGYTISNIRIAKGLPDTRHKLVEEGSFSTTGIRFAVNAWSLLPSSAGVLREIADVLTRHPDIKIKIIGHTDSDGDEAANLLLSSRRATAVKDALVNDYKIDESRIMSEGAGETKPIADNATKEGKANNRRVEFIRN